MYAWTIQTGIDVYFFLIERPHLLNLPKNFWSSVALEWLVAQSLIAYSYFRFVSYKSYYKQVIAMLWIISALALYLALLQLELFACFMFVAEFTVVIFFYTLFLHLKVSIDDDKGRHWHSNTPLVSAIVLGFLAAVWNGSTRFINAEVSLAFSELYKRISYASPNDLPFFASTILRTNLSIHLIVGLILLFLTLFLFFTVNVYYFLNISKRDAHRQSVAKLATERGYYDQTAEEVQKIIKNVRR